VFIPLHYLLDVAETMVPVPPHVKELNEAEAELGVVLTPEQREA